MLYISGPGHGAPAVLANSYLEGTYSEVYPDRSQDEEGMRQFFKLFSFPGGIGSHCTPETPGSIHEGGELGYSLSHAFGAAFDNPDLIVAAVVGDGEAETGPLATSWHSNKFLNPIRDGAVLPILHLNGYKIANPTILARIPAEELESLFVGYGYKPYVVEGDDPPAMHQKMAATLERCIGEIRAIQEEARRSGVRAPAALADDNSAHAERLDRAEGGRRPSGRGLLAGASGADTGRRDESRASQIARSMDASYRPRRAVRRAGPADRRTYRRSRQRGNRRISANPHANGGLLRKPLRMPDFRDYAVEVAAPGPVGEAENTYVLGAVSARRDARQHAQFPRLRPRRNRVEPAAGDLRGQQENLARRDASPRTPTAANCLPTAG